MVFEKTLPDIVKGIRASKRDTALYISSCIAEIKSEINSTDPHTKANALQKLTFLQMMGYNMSYASFATIEVMSSPRFAFKRIGYLAASQAFTQDTDVVLLTTNTLKKELRGAVGPGMNGVYEAGLAINCLSNIVTEDLARDLLADVTNLIVHPQPYLRKKAILCLLKMFMKYPQGLRLTFSKLQDSLLKDINPSVTSCAVNVITELSDKNPKNYLVLAPSFFSLLTTSSNNWMLIKVVKLLGSLVPEEPRLARKLLDPLVNIVQNTQAKSLLYESVYTITLCLPYCQKNDGSMPSNVSSIVSICAKTLQSFIQEHDQNLKYLGLVGFGSLMVSYPKVLAGADYRGLILTCLSDDDVTIRTRALDLLIGVASRRNVMELVTQLLHHVDMAIGTYKIDLVVKIVEICSRDKYSLLTDFAWYMDILVVLARTKGIDNKQNELGPLISGQITDVTLRVLPVRAFSVQRMIHVLLQDGQDANQNCHHNSVGTFGMTTTFNMMPEVLPAAAWILGEYALLIDEAVSTNKEVHNENKLELDKYDSTSVGTYHAVIQALTDPSNVNSTPATTQSIYIQAAMKVFSAASGSKDCNDAELEACLSRLVIYLPVFMQSMDPEVQERSFTAFQLLKSLRLVKETSLIGNSPSKLIDEDSINNSEKNTETKQNDLLNLVMISTYEPSSQNEDSQINTSDGSDSHVQKIRRASTTLKYLLIPEQMKPISTKAQRKKRQSVPENIRTALQEPVKISVFAKLLEGDKERVNGKRNIEAVSFTQQKPMRSMTRGLPKKTNVDNLILDINMPIVEATAATSSQTNSGTALNNAFYLTSKHGDGKSGNESHNRFGAIQLIGNDESDSDGEQTKKKKKKRDKRRKKKLVDSVDLGVFESATHLKNTPNRMIDSDDEEEVDVAPLVAMIQGKSKIQMKPNLADFDVLAQIDLTTPLREDETMPTIKHREVPDHHAVEEVPKKMKKRKKSKTSKMKKHDDTSNAPRATNVPHSTADLLDLGGFTATTTAQSNNIISNAFDDLLALDVNDTPSQTDQLLMAGSKPIVNKKNTKIWQEATIKSSKAVGIVKTFDWNDLKILYRTHNSKNGDMSEIYLSIKTINGGSGMLNNIQISLKGYDEQITITALGPNSMEETKKVGPLSIDLSSSIPELRGSLNVLGCTLPIKFIIPSFIHSLHPMPDINQDNVSDLLAGAEWSASNAKVEISGSLTHQKMKNILKSLLQAHEFNFDASGNGMFASQGENGCKILVLVKSNGDTIKADIKSTDKDIAKAISAAIKRLVL